MVDKKLLNQGRKLEAKTEALDDQIASVKELYQSLEAEISPVKLKH